MKVIDLDKYLFPMREVDVTDSIMDLRSVENSLIQPGRTSMLMSVEERLIGVKFSVIYRNVGEQDETTFVVIDDAFNKSFAPHIDFTDADVHRILTDLPGAGMDRFRGANCKTYTVHCVYYDNQILSKHRPRYNNGGVVVTDVIIHSDDSEGNTVGLILDYEKREDFVARLSMKAPKLRFHDIMQRGAQGLSRMANTSEMATNGIGAGIRISIEPREDNLVYIVIPTEEQKAKQEMESVKGVLLEAVGSYCSPKILEIVYDKTHLNPKESVVKFVNSVIKYMDQQFSGRLHDYFIRAHSVDKELDQKEFRKMLAARMRDRIKVLADEMDLFKLLEDKEEE